MQEQLDKSSEEQCKQLAKKRRYTEIKELTPAIVNEFIDYIMVSKKQMIDGKTVYPIDIYYSGIGIINSPSKEKRHSHKTIP